MERAYPGVTPEAERRTEVWVRLEEAHGAG
jgi:hypothetical protein